MTDDVQQRFGAELQKLAAQEKTELEELRQRQRTLQQEQQQTFSNCKSRLNNFQAEVDSKGAQLRTYESAQP